MHFRTYPRIYFELIFIAFSIMMGMFIATSFLPIFAEDLDPSRTLVGMVVSAWFLSRVFVELPAGILSDRIGRKKLLISGIGFSALGSFLCSQAVDIYVLIIGRSVWGLGAALFFTNNTALIIDLFDPKIRGRALGTFQSAEFIGSFLGLPIGGYLTGLFSFRDIFFFSLAFSLGPLALALVSRSFRFKEARDRSKKSPSIGNVVASLSNLGIAIACMGAFTRMFVKQGILSTVLELHLNKDLGIPLTEIGIILSLGTAGYVIATASSGFLCDRFGRASVLMSGFLIDAASLAIFTSITGIETFMAFSFFQGLGEGIVFTGLIVLLSDMAPPSARGGAIGLYRTFQDIGGFIGPLFFMIIYVSTSSQVAFLGAAAINVVNVIILYLARGRLSMPRENI